MAPMREQVAKNSKLSWEKRLIKRKTQGGAIWSAFIFYHKERRIILEKPEIRTLLDENDTKLLASGVSLT